MHEFYGAYRLTPRTGRKKPQLTRIVLGRGVVFSLRLRSSLLIIIAQAVAAFILLILVDLYIRAAFFNESLIRQAGNRRMDENERMMN